MEYRVRATDEGFELGLARPRGTELFLYEEKGGHGPIETLYAQAESAWRQARGAQDPGFKRVGS